MARQSYENLCYGLHGVPLRLPGSGVAHSPASAMYEQHATAACIRPSDCTDAHRHHGVSGSGWHLAKNAWFNTPTSELSVLSRFTVEMLRENRFDYVVIGQSLNLPLWYREPLCAALIPYRNDWQEGACGNLAVPFCDACRVTGIAAKFISGYECVSASSQNSYMYAWAEVYWPGIGWRGYDPSRGFAVSNRHVAVEDGFDHDLASPVAGGGSGS